MNIFSVCAGYVHDTNDTSYKFVEILVWTSTLSLTPPSSRPYPVHFGPTPPPFRVDVINGWPLMQLWTLVVYQRNHSRVGSLDDDVSAETKVLVVVALTLEGQDETCKRISVEDAEIVSKQLPDLVSVHARKLFAALSITEDFIHQHPTEWDTHNRRLQAGKGSST